MFEYRVTKYDPRIRNSGGTYSEWTSVSDIGKSFDGVPLTSSEYQRVESTYIASALAFLREAGVPSLTVRALENHSDATVVLADGDVVSLEQVSAILPQVLREKFWCKLEGLDSFIHVGYDYYMYVGVPVDCPKAEQLAANLGLFVEPFQSPYGESDAA
ncbi:hypothetical protein D3C71_719170 [compost metagenome]